MNEIRVELQVRRHMSFFHSQLHFIHSLIHTFIHPFIHSGWQYCAAILPATVLPHNCCCCCCRSNTCTHTHTQTQIQQWTPHPQLRHVPHIDYRKEQSTTSTTNIQVQANIYPLRSHRLPFSFPSAKFSDSTAHQPPFKVAFPVGRKVLAASLPQATQRVVLICI